MSYDELNNEPLNVSLGDEVNLHLSSIGEIRKFHVMNVLDGHYQDQKFIFGRFYGKRKQYWHHIILDEFEFKLARDRAR
jgi:hypothetical protein